jgi:hypothetical protein
VIAPARVERMPLRTTFSPLRFAARSNEAPPMNALPLKPAQPPVLGLPAFLPRLAFGSMLPVLAGAGSDDCAAHSPTLQLSVLPSSPFVPANCTRRSLRDAADTLPSLAPGRNKNALYGPGISANELTDPQ